MHPFVSAVASNRVFFSNNARLTSLILRSHYPEHGFADALTVRSRMFDACLVIDGGISYVFNDGATVSLSMHDEDSLRTVRLIDD